MNIEDDLKERDSEYMEACRDRFDVHWKDMMPRPPYEEAFLLWKAAYGWGWMHGMEEACTK